ncbi:hypothetical protein [Arthrobacter sp. JUb115]|uniref:hypothetical protein n=1 Tax=Arthrobacter sp. JUb115 TaxID=2485108 RepID=UPI0010601DC1|nr:hypothetical protein [Arthrobacter sp. JUb115]TDU26041.1 hypothetical protein EDF61_105104 [Arthrobacter sp. JUb115]
MNAQELISLPDIARLANVQRPVVSVWRTRSRGTDFPFPDSKLKSGAQELFVSEEIVQWLQVTGRGNNPEFKEDSASYATLGRENFPLVTSLLSLQQFLGRPLSQFSPIELLDAADELDPDDECLYSEIEAGHDKLASIVGYVDKLIDASYGALPAFESLFNDRFRANEIAISRTALSGPARRLVAQCALELAGPDSVFHEATPGGSDLIYALMQLVEESASLQIQLPSATGERDTSRLTVRRLKMLLATNESFIASTPSHGIKPIIHLAQFPSPEMQDDDPLAVLQAIDDLVLELGPSHSAIVIAPANALVNATDHKEVANVRASILRMGRVRAAALLPQGHFLFKPRIPLGLWVIGPDTSDAPLAERRIMLADLSGLPLDDNVTDDFVADLAASLMELHGLRAHSFRFARWGRTSRIIASSQGLIPRNRVKRLHTHADAASLAEHQVEFEKLLTALNESSVARPQLNWELQLRESEAQPVETSGLRTLGELVSQGQLRVLPGTRFNKDSLRATVQHGIGVWNSEDIQSEQPTASISYFNLAQAYGRAVITEPGDIVFSSSGGPAATVDVEGSKAVNFPVRILRINSTAGSGLHPQVLAQDITNAESANWRQWAVRKIPPNSYEAMRRALQLIDEERQHATSRIELLNSLSSQITSALLSDGLEILVPERLRKDVPSGTN